MQSYSCDRTHIKLVVGLEFDSERQLYRGLTFSDYVIIEFLSIPGCV